MRKLVSVALAGLAVATLWSLTRQTRQAAPQNPLKGRIKPVQVHTWEGEGGALPDIGSHTGPQPSVTQSTADASVH
jgi:hypothetical protein